jgi:transcriptional regulator with XRE-family HTH domain
MTTGTGTTSATHPRDGFGATLRAWRERRRLSQTDLAGEVPLSQRHLSCLERGIARPSRETALRLAEVLGMPAEATNGLLTAAGFAPAHRARPLSEPGMRAIREAIDRVLAAHAPYPALAVDRHWTLVAANAGLAPLVAGVDPRFLAPPVNVLRLSLHPEALAPRILNLREWRAHVLRRLEREIEGSGDGVLIDLAGELAGYPLPPGARPYRPPRHDPFAGIAVPLVLATEAGRLSFISTTTVFGTAIDVTVSGLAIESFLPADAATAELVRRMGGAP